MSTKKKKILRGGMAHLLPRECQPLNLLVWEAFDLLALAILFDFCD